MKTVKEGRRKERKKGKKKEREREQISRNPNVLSSSRQYKIQLKR
jgi:hypothetical protein